MIYDIEKNLQKTKIITTIGPVTETYEALAKLYEAGMTTARLNFSHGSHSEHLKKIEFINQLSKNIDRPISIMLDTRGPEIRVGKMLNDAQQITAGEIITIYCDTNSYLNKVCNQNEMTVSYDMSKDLKKDDLILVDDGKLEIFVNKVSPGIVIGKAFNSHMLHTNKRINLPNIDFSLPFLSKRDIDDINFGIDHGINYIAASFVNNINNVYEIREILKKRNSEHIQVLSKIESQTGINNIDDIIEVSDGILIGRGDLGLEIPYYDLPYWEKQIIRKCRAKGKVCIVATQMLESMINNPSPTRAEVSDVYFATEMGADATMLSGESANGLYPFLTVKVMSNINKRAEKEFYSKLFYKKQFKNAKATTYGERAEIAKQLTESTMTGDYRYAVVLSNTGELLKTLSKFRPNVLLLSITENFNMYNAYGVWHSIAMNLVDDAQKYRTNPKLVIEVAKKWGAKKGEKILFVHKKRLIEYTIN